MADSKEMENLKLTIMAEVNSKIGEANKQFDEIVEQLDREGTEFARKLKSEIEGMRDNVAKEVENVWSYLKSKLVSIEAGQRMLYDPKDGIMTKLLEKVDMAVKMSRDAAACTAACMKTNEEAQAFVITAREGAKEDIKEGKKVLYGLVIALIILMLPVSVASIWKIFQDNANQKQTATLIGDLKKGVTIKNFENAFQGMDKDMRAQVMRMLQGE